MLACAATLVAWTAFGPSDAYAQKRGGNFVFDEVAAVSTLDPHFAVGFSDSEAVHQMFEGLVEIGEDYSAKLMLASKIDINSDATAFTFTLRKGVKFHNGKEMTSRDVIGSFERYKKVSPNAVVLGDVTSMVTPDPYTFVIKLNHPNAMFIELLKSPSFPLSIIPAELKDAPARDIEPIGTGPFQLQEWRKDSYLILKRFDGYVPDDSATKPDGFAGRKTVWIDTLRYNSVPEANTRIAALQTGGADFISNVPNDAKKRLEGRSDSKLLAVSPYCQSAFFMNAKNPPTSNNRSLRQAITALVDGEEMMEAGGQVWDRNPSLMYKTSYYYSDVGAPFYDRHSVEVSKALLKAANYKGEKVVLETNANYTYMRDASQVLIERMKQAGINVELKMVDWTTNQGDMAKGTGDWNITTTSFCSPPLLGPQQWRLGLAYAQLGDDQVINDGYAKLFSATDPADRKKAWMNIEKYVLEEGYFAKVADFADLRGVSTKWDGITPYYFQRFWDVWAK